MNSNKRFRVDSAVVLLVGLVLSANALGEGRKENSPRPDSLDVEIQSDGTVRGQVVGAPNQAKSPSTIALLSVDKWNNRATVTATCQANPEGYFVFRDIRPGQYELRTKWSRRVVRLWSRGTAPPESAQSLAIVEDSLIVRGQFGGSIFMPTPADLLFWGTVAVGVGVPLAVTDNDPPGS